MYKDELDLVIEPFQTRHNSNLPQVAAVLDDFSNQSFSDSANIWRVFPDTACVDIELIRPDLLLVESAWAGNFETWKYKVTHNKRPSRDLVNLVESAKKLGIPTVFWNKEDPPHFGDFVATASLFEYIFTTEESVIPRYYKETPAEVVDLLRFAANPVIHNPRRVPGYRQGDICFAGMFFQHKYAERREQMLTLFPPAMDFNFEIYSRHAGGDSRYQFPEPFEDLVVGKLPYSQMVEAYRKYKVFLNVNSVPQSRSMCARRVYELSASKTAVVGMESEAIRSIYSDDEVLLAQDASEVGEIYRTLLENDSERRKITQRAWRTTLSAHTYDHRMRQVLGVAGLSADISTYKVRVLVTNMRQGLNAFDFVSNQEFTLDHQVDLQIVDFSSKAAEQKLDLSNAYVAVMDAEYRYGRFYLNDLILTLKQQRCDFACKAPGWESGFESVEEDYTLELPDYGWMAAPGRLESLEDLEKLESCAVELGSVYMGDPCGISQKGIESKLLDV